MWCLLERSTTLKTSVVGGADMVESRVACFVVAMVVAYGANEQHTQQESTFSVTRRQFERSAAPSNRGKPRVTTIGWCDDATYT